MIPVFSIVAYSDTGKTTFMEKLLPILKSEGIRTAVVKHDSHGFEIDKEGKDSYRITKAGADITGIVSKDRSVLMENRPRDMDHIFGRQEEIAELRRYYDSGKPEAGSQAGFRRRSPCRGTAASAPAPPAETADRKSPSIFVWSFCLSYQ